MNVDISGINVNYIKEGESGSAILLLHGWGSNLTLFEAMINSLKKEHVVYALDLPGFGNTEEPDFAWNVDNYTDFVIKFIKEMKIESLSILGHSFGGRIIIKLLNRENLSFKVEKIVLLDSAGIKPKNNGSNTFRAKYYRFAKKIVTSRIVKKIAKNAEDNLKSKFGSEDYKNATPLMRDVLVKTVNEDLTDLLQNIKVPTLLVWGDKDIATPLGDAEIMKERIEDAGLVVVKGGSHYSFLDNPVYVNTVLLDFFKDR